MKDVSKEDALKNVVYADKSLTLDLMVCSRKKEITFSITQDDICSMPEHLKEMFLVMIDIQHNDGV